MVSYLKVIFLKYDYLEMLVAYRETQFVTRIPGSDIQCRLAKRLPLGVAQPLDNFDAHSHAGHGKGHCVSQFLEGS